MTRETFIFNAETSERADVFLARMMPDFSRAEIQKMEKSVPNARRLKAGESVWVEAGDRGQGLGVSSPVQLTPNPYPLIPVLYEDDDIIAVNKPRGMVMYPAVGNREGTLVQVLGRSLSALGGDVRPGVVHRIDKDTSGVVVLAKSDRAYRELVKVFSEHKLTRKYLAFVWGVPTWTEADITGNIARSSRNRQKMSMVKIGGKPAETIANVINVWTRANISEMRCELKTGRTHQIRVHLSAHGFPVLTDPTYGRGGETKLKQGPLLSFLREHSGQFLHAEVLELAHPVTGEPLKFRAPAPEDFSELKELLDEY
jgi:23S rRNA pseudouridine1911/1915/1917 synthase